MVTTEKLKVSWGTFGKQINTIARIIASQPIEFTRVVGVSRGGLPLGVALSHKLNLPLSVVGVSSYNDETSEQESLICDTPNVIFEGWEGNVLIVDDIADSGKTLDFLLRKIVLLANRNISVVTATLYYKECSIIKPDIFLETTDRWVIFPWESK
jgi:hypoxanthine phosphoribosyltransferase